MRNRASVADREASRGFSTIFRSETLASIVAFFTDRGLAQVQVADLERELERKAKFSRGAIENSLRVLVQAGLVGIRTSGRNRVCEVRRPAVWAKLGELFDLERQSTGPVLVGMPWLADAVSERPRRTGFAIRPAEPAPEPDLERVEAALAKLPAAEAPRPGRRAPAPGRRR